jgi:FixJ family two-component response regulator
MPEGNGDLVALSVKARTPETPVILLTGFGDIMKDEKECPVGVDRVLTKPATRQDLRRAIAKVMGKRNAPRRPAAGQVAPCGVAATGEVGSAFAWPTADKTRNGE